MNEGIPPETILRHVLEENKKLQLENEQLKAEIKWRDEAIAAFKKWQSKVAQYKYDYWVTEGLKFMEEQPEEKRFKQIRRLLIHYNKFDHYFQIAEKNYERVLADREKLKRLEEQENKENKK